MKKAKTKAVVSYIVEGETKVREVDMEVDVNELDRLQKLISEMYKE